MLSDEILKVVFGCLEAKDLAKCLLVSKLWKEIAEDDYFWRSLCTKKWPSICKNSQSQPPTSSYYKLYKMFYKRYRNRELPPPKLSFIDLEFYIDIWSDDKILYSEIVQGEILQKGSWILPNGISDILRFHLSSSDYKMTLPIHPRFNIPVDQTVSVSILVARRDLRKVACIINKSVFDYIDRSMYRALAFDYLDFSAQHFFVNGVRAWISLLFMDHGSEGVNDVFGIELDFCDAANSEDQVLWLLDMLDWQ